MSALRWTSASLAAAFVALAVTVGATGGVPGERRLLELVVSRAGDRWDGAAEVVDRATDSLPLALVTAVVVLALVRAGRSRAGVLVALSVAGAVVGNPVLKRLVDRPRPDLLEHAEGVSALSFPSGHAAGSVALAVAAVLATAGVRSRAAVVVAAVLLVVVPAAVQLVLARHHPSDVLGGWLWAGAWTTALWAEAGRRTGTPPTG